MKVVIAPQAFKGGLSGMEAARAMEEGVRRVFPSAETVLVPVADGGDGTLDALVDGSSGRYFETLVSNPLGEPVLAQWGVMGDGKTAVIEMARASGLALVPVGGREPRLTTTYGTGELIRAALEAGYREIIVGLGGSATNDGGAGIAQALGAKLTDSQGGDIQLGGAALAHLKNADLQELDPRLAQCRLRAATDVSNPLCGLEGASAVYGPQKGATPDIVVELDAALMRFAQVIRREVGMDVLTLPRAGAAGGAGAGMVALLGAQLESGGDLVCDAVGLDSHLEGATLILTGEGRLDGQTLYDKAPIVVASRAMARGIPVIVVAGSLGPGYHEVLEHGVNSVEVAMLDSMPIAEAMANAYELVRDATERVVAGRALHP